MLTKTDQLLKQDIEQELRWDPAVNSAQIGVSVDEGAVALFGTVDSYAEKWAASAATERVGGVRSFAQDLKVKVAFDHVRTDSEIAAAIQDAFKWNTSIPATVHAKVEAGAVMLDGRVPFHFQRVAAEDAVRNLAGVIAVNNDITLEPSTTVSRVKESIIAALQRRAMTDASSIEVVAADGVVTLRGHTASFRSMADARNAAWAAPGVTDVIDLLVLDAPNS